MKKPFSFLLVLLLVASLSMAAWGDLKDLGQIEVSVMDSVSLVDSGNNLLAAGESLSVTKGVYFGGFGAGKDISVRNSKLKDTLALAAQDITLEDTEIGGSAFLAGYDLNIHNTAIGGNLFAAGYNVAITGENSANTVYAAGNQVSFSGTAKGLSLGGEDVFVDGVIDGDVNISANRVSISDDTVINGKLTVQSLADPMADSKAEIGEYSFSLTENTKTEIKEIEDMKESVVEFWDENGAKIKMSGWIYSLLTSVVIALLMSWLIPGQLVFSAETVKRHPAAIIVSGILLLVLVPVIFLLLCVTIVGVPAALVLLTVYILAMSLALPFAGASLGRMIFPNMPGVLSALIGVVLLKACKLVPYLSAAVALLCIVYSLGTFFQMMWNSRKKKQLALPENVYNV